MTTIKQEALLDEEGVEAIDQEKTQVILRHPPNGDLSTLPTLFPAPIANIITALSSSARLSIKVSAWLIEAIIESLQYTTHTSMSLLRRILVTAISSARRVYLLSHSAVDGDLLRIMGMSNPSSTSDQSIKIKDDGFLSVLDKFTNLGIYIIHSTFTMAELFTMSSFYLTSKTLMGIHEAAQESVTLFDSLFGSNESSRALAAIIGLIKKEVLVDERLEGRGRIASLAALTRSLTAFSILQAATRRVTEEKFKMTVVYDCTVVLEKDRITTSKRLDDQASRSSNEENSIAGPGPTTLALRDRSMSPGPHTFGGDDNTSTGDEDGLGAATTGELANQDLSDPSDPLIGLEELLGHIDAKDDWKDFDGGEEQYLDPAGFRPPDEKACSVNNTAQNTKPKPNWNPFNHSRHRSSPLPSSSKGTDYFLDLEAGPSVPRRRSYTASNDEEDEWLAVDRLLCDGSRGSPYGKYLPSESDDRMPSNRNLDHMHLLLQGMEQKIMLRKRDRARRERAKDMDHLRGRYRPFSGGGISDGEPDNGVNDTKPDSVAGTCLTEDVIKDSKSKTKNGFGRSDPAKSRSFPDQDWTPKSSRPPTREHSPDLSPRKSRRINRSQPDDGPVPTAYAPSPSLLPTNRNRLITDISETSSEDRPSESLSISRHDRNMDSPGSLFPHDSLINNIHRFMKYSSAAYGQSFLRILGLGDSSFNFPSTGRHHSNAWSFCHHTGIPIDSLLLSSYTETSNKIIQKKVPPLIHYVAVDHSLKCIILTCRGTLGLSDVLVDLTCTYCSIEIPGGSEDGDYYVHEGMYAAALQLTAKRSKVHQALVDALNQYTEYGLVLTGHSLGGGVAGLLSIISSEPATTFLNSNQRLSKPHNHPRISTPFVTSLSSGLPPGRPIHAYCFGIPAIGSIDLATYSSGLITSVIQGTDIVPCLSLGVLRDLKNVAVTLSEEGNIAQEIVGRVIGLYSGKKRSKENAMEEGLLDEEGEMSDWMLSLIKTMRADMDNDKLFPPGTVYIMDHYDIFLPIQDEITKKVKQQKAHRVVLRQCDSVEDRFREILFTKSMFNDHLPSRYERSTQLLYEGLKQQTTF